MHNTFSFAYEGTSTYFQATSVANYLTNEQDYVPWKVFNWHINRISLIAEHRPSFKQIRVLKKSNIKCEKQSLYFTIKKAFCLQLTRKLANSLDLASDDGSWGQRMLRVEIIEFLCRLHDPDCLKYADVRFNSIPVQHFNEPENTAFKNP